MTSNHKCAWSHDGSHKWLRLCIPAIEAKAPGIYHQCWWCDLVRRAKLRPGEGNGVIETYVPYDVMFPPSTLTERTLP